MADFREMYYMLFRAQVKAKAILDEAEKKAEEMFEIARALLIGLTLIRRSRIIKTMRAKKSNK